MGLFSKKQPVPEKLGDAGYSVLSAGLTVYGDIDTDGTLRVDGTLEGSVRRAGMVLLGESAVVRGNVHAREVVVGGSIEGNIEATDRVELQSSATVTGDIQAGAILMHEGGVVRGRLHIRARQAEEGKKRRGREEAPAPTTPTLVSATGAAS